MFGLNNDWFYIEEIEIVLHIFLRGLLQEIGMMSLSDINEIKNLPLLNFSPNIRPF